MTKLPQSDYAFPAHMSPDALNNELVMKSYELAYKQLVDGTASPSVITHFLKMGTTMYELEMEKVRHENSLLGAKKQQIDSEESADKKYEAAMNAMKRYKGFGEEDVQ